MPVKMLPTLEADTARMKELDAQLRPQTYSKRALDRRRPERKRRNASHGGEHWRKEKKLSHEQRRKTYLQKNGKYDLLLQEFPSKRLL